MAILLRTACTETGVLKMLLRRKGESHSLRSMFHLTKHLPALSVRRAFQSNHGQTASNQLNVLKAKSLVSRPKYEARRKDFHSLAAQVAMKVDGWKRRDENTSRYRAVMPPHDCRSRLTEMLVIGPEA